MAVEINLTQVETNKTLAKIEAGTSISDQETPGNQEITPADEKTPLAKNWLIVLHTNTQRWSRGVARNLVGW